MHDARHGQTILFDIVGRSLLICTRVRVHQVAEPAVTGDQ